MPFLLKCNPKMLSGALEAVAAVASEVTVHVEPDGVWVNCMDPAKVAMVSLVVEPMSFEVFDCSEGEAVGIDLRGVLKILKRAGGKDPLKIAGNQNGVELTFLGRMVRRFTLPVLEAAGEEPPGEVKMEPSVRVDMLVDDFLSLLKDASEVAAETVKLRVDFNGLAIAAKGSLSSVEAKVEGGSDPIISIDVKEAAEASYSLSYLMGIVKAASNASNVVSIMLKRDKPILLDFKPILFNGALKYYVAPRIEVE